MKRREFLKVSGVTAAATALGPWSVGSTRRAELATLRATRQLELFAARRLSPLDVLDAQIARVESPGLAGFDQAVAAARESERRYRRGDARALEGVTVGVTDARDPVADRLREAGAVLHVPGGDSGAALAAGMCTLAAAPDRRGSLRIAAAHNGIYAFRRPRRRVATVDDLLVATSGAMGRTLADTVLLEAAIAGPESKGPMTAGWTDVADVRIAYCGAARGGRSGSGDPAEHRHGRSVDVGARGLDR